MTILFHEIPTASGHRFGHATLSAPASLNALSLAMIDRLAPQLDAWLADERIVGIVLDGEGDKAFCAGGDVQALYRSMRDTEPGQVPREAAAFFEREYRLDHRIHTARKPIVCWGHGIVMGGGLGLFAGASHRVATPTTRIAMPEITIGLYPDVGGSWFLPRLPGRSGLFLALSAAPLNAADARFAGLADVVLPHDAKPALLQELGQATWRGERQADASQLTALLQRLATTPPVDSPLQNQLDLIDTVIGSDDSLALIGARLSALASHTDPWLASAGRTYTRGSPTSAALSWALWQRARHLPLADVFRLEYQVSLGCCMHGDFAEGVRALLIDKDRNPRWAPARLADVTSAHVDAHFTAHQTQPTGPHPLADLT